MYISKRVQSVHCEVLECAAKQSNTGVESRQTDGATVGLNTSNQPLLPYHDLDHDDDDENNEEDDNTPDLVPSLDFHGIGHGDGEGRCTSEEVINGHSKDGEKLK